MNIAIFMVCGKRQSLLKQKKDKSTFVNMMFSLMGVSLLTPCIEIKYPIIRYFFIIDR